jgi:SNF2-related domain
VSCTAISGDLATCSKPRHNAYDSDSGDNDDDAPMWDVMILDEGHKIKNPSTKLYKVLQRFSSRMRVIITGTPMQNNFMELHALFDFCCPELLGSRPHFKREFADPIQYGQARAVAFSALSAHRFCLRKQVLRFVMSITSGAGHSTLHLSASRPVLLRMF